MNRIVLLGTGCPSPSHIRYGPSTLISTKKQKILIDAGSGVAQRLSEFGLAPSEIDVILITHLHSDHIVDLYQLYPYLVGCQLNGSLDTLLQWRTSL